MKILNAIFNGFVAAFSGIGVEIAAYVIAGYYVFGCYWLFDTLHITNSNTRFCIGIVPFLMLTIGAIWAARRGKIKVHRDKIK